MNDKIKPVEKIQFYKACAALLITISFLLISTIITKGTSLYIGTSILSGIAITIIVLSLQEWTVHRYLYHRYHKNFIMKHIYSIHHIGHHSVIFPPERYVTNGEVKRHPIFENDVKELGKSKFSNILTRLSHSGSYILLSCITIIGPCWLITKNGILLISTLVSTIIICHVVVTVHDAIHYPSQHPYMQNQKWFKFLDNHHLIHHIDTEKNVNFLLPICDFLFGTMRFSLSKNEIDKFGTLDLAKKNLLGYSEPAKKVLKTEKISQHTSSIRHF